MGAPIGTVMFFVADPERACRWWAEHVGGGAACEAEGPFWWYEAEGVEVGFHPADEERNPVGRSPVVYWRVEGLAARRAALIEAGCTPHRGPLVVGPDRQICQLVDPFGNCFGLDGPEG
jgi:hypothetical protein